MKNLFSIFYGQITAKQDRSFEGSDGETVYSTQIILKQNGTGKSERAVKISFYGDNRDKIENFEKGEFVKIYASPKMNTKNTVLSINGFGVEAATAKDKGEGFTYKFKVKTCEEKTSSKGNTFANIIIVIDERDLKAVIFGDEAAQLASQARRGGVYLYGEFKYDGNKSEKGIFFNSLMIENLSSAADIAKKIDSKKDQAPATKAQVLEKLAEEAPSDELPF